MRPSIRLATILSLMALAAAPVAQAPSAWAQSAPASDTRLGTASFDAGSSAIVVPYTGAAPQPKLYTITQQHHYYEFPGARLSRAAVQYRRVGGALERYTMANRPYPAVRLSFKLTQNAQPTIQVDAARKRILVWPLGKAMKTTVPAPPQVAARPQPTPKPSVAPATPKPSAAPFALKPSATPATPGPDTQVRIPTGLTPPKETNTLKVEIGKPTFDDFHHRLVLPFKGSDPNFKVSVYYKNPRWVYFDFDQAYINVEGERFETFDDPVFEGWMLSQRPDGLKSRLYLKLKQPTQVVAQVHVESGEIWLEAVKK